MTSFSETLACPKGHLSTEADYCSECGAKLRGGADVPISSSAPAGQVCPDCGTVREQNDIAFCEVCGYNFVTGAHGELGILPVAEPSQSDIEADSANAVISHTSEREETVDTPALHWQVTVTVDPALRAADSPDPPIDVAPLTFALEQPVNLIGRRDETRAIHPEIALPLDEAVSRRHALLQQGGASGMLLRDIGAANGTKLNGVDLEPMVDYPVKDGDEITLGHWSRILVRAQ